MDLLEIGVKNKGTAKVYADIAGDACRTCRGHAALYL